MASVNELTESDIPGADLHEPLENATVATRSVVVASLPWHSGTQIMEKGQVDRVVSPKSVLQS